MSRLSFWLLSISLAGTISILLLHSRKTRRQSIFLLCLVLVLAIVPLFTIQLPFSEIGKPRGAGDEDLWFLVALYISLLLGMLAQYGYTRFSRPRRHRPKFDLGLSIAPIFTSPIIFIPLLGSVQSAGVDLYQADSARLMLFLVAFENGFFWKLIFDQRQKILEPKDKQ